MSQPYSQTFRLPTTHSATLGRILISLGLGFIVWILSVMLLIWLFEKLVKPIGDSPVALVLFGLTLLSGIFFVPLYVFFRSYAAEKVTLTLSPEAGLTVVRSSLRQGAQNKQYAWKDISGTEMSGTTHVDGTVTEYRFHLSTSDGDEIQIPTSTESFNYFVDLINRNTIHIPHTWKYIDYTNAKSSGTTYGWHRFQRE